MERYIGDIFMIWTDTIAELMAYLNNLYNIHPTIKFTWEILHKQVVFLDAVFSKGRRFEDGGLLDTAPHFL